MLTVLHILGNEPHESVHRNIYDESVFFKRHGVDVRFIYDPALKCPFEINYVDALRAAGFPMYQLRYLPPPGGGAGGAGGADAKTAAAAGSAERTGARGAEPSILLR